MKRKSKVTRVPKRAVYDREEIYKILDQENVCHVGIIHNNVPVVIPTIYGRDGDKIYVHGSAASRLINELEKGIEVCLSIARVTGMVLARSAFHHSLNYNSVVLFGRGTLVDENEKLHALKIISEHIIKERWDEVRPPTKKELKATKIIEIEIDEISAKIRTGPPNDDEIDLKLNVWAGTIPINQSFGEPIPDENVKKEISISQSIEKLMKIG